MTPAGHYAEAERLLSNVGRVARGDKPVTREQTQVINEALAAAQVHATLATVDRTAALEAGNL